MENNYPFSEESINSSISFRSLVNATSYPGRHFQITKLKNQIFCQMLPLQY